ncbi:MAG: cupin domain-containing protein [Candidatus Scalinduaceae bacterium]
MGIIQIKKIEFSQDDRGWSIKPITDEEIKTGKISEIHMVSMRQGAVRGNHYHINKTEYVLTVGGPFRVVIMDNNTKKKEEKTIVDKTLLVIPPNVTHAIENIGSNISYLFCYSKTNKCLSGHDVVINEIIQKSM